MATHLDSGFVEALSLISICISYILYRILIEIKWNSYEYRINYKLVRVFRLLDKVLLLIFPLLMLMYLISYMPINKLCIDFPYLKGLWGTIYCSPLADSNENGQKININVQHNTNIQESLPSSHNGREGRNIINNLESANEQINKNYKI